MRVSWIHSTLLLALALLASCAATEEQRARVGVYDSRALAIAYGRSELQSQETRQLVAEYEKAEAAGDVARMEKLSQEGRNRQARLHRQAFSTGNVDEILALIGERLPAIARAAGVSELVSRWDPDRRDPDAETVDVTMAMVLLFDPSEETLAIVEQLKHREPVPLEELENHEH